MLRCAREDGTANRICIRACSRRANAQVGNFESCGTNVSPNMTACFFPPCLPPAPQRAQLPHNGPRRPQASRGASSPSPRAPRCRRRKGAAPTSPRRSRHADATRVQRDLTAARAATRSLSRWYGHARSAMLHKWRTRCASTCRTPASRWDSSATPQSDANLAGDGLTRRPSAAAPRNAAHDGATHLVSDVVAADCLAIRAAQHRSSVHSPTCRPHIANRTAPRDPKQIRKLARQNPTSPGAGSSLDILCRRVNFWTHAGPQSSLVSRRRVPRRATIWRAAHATRAHTTTH